MEKENLINIEDYSVKTLGIDDIVYPAFAKDRNGTLYLIISKNDCLPHCEKLFHVIDIENNSIRYNLTKNTFSNIFKNEGFIFHYATITISE